MQTPTSPNSIALTAALALAGLHTPSHAATLRVPDGFATIQRALNAATSGDTLVIDGSVSPYDEAIRIDTSRLHEVTLAAHPAAPSPVISGDATTDPIITIDAASGAPATVRIRGVSIDGQGKERYGIRAYTADYETDDVLLDLQLDSVAIRHCRIGMQIGTRTGAYRCDGNWGAVSEELLGQATSRVTVSGCSITSCLVDGMNLYRTTGGIYDTFIGFNGDEGVHMTAAEDFEVRHSIIVKNNNVGFHFQLGSNVRFENCVVLGTEDPGYGLSIEGMRGSEPLRVYNNVFSWQHASGLKISPVVLRLLDGNCEGVPVVADVRNNIFADNGAGDESHEDLLFRDAEVPNTLLFARYNLFDRGSNEASNAMLNNTNLFNADPGFVAELHADQLPDVIPQSIDVYSVAWAQLAGLGLADRSEAIDSGEPQADFEDEGGLARGSAVNDIGAFGGPNSDWGI
ncbi:MAG: hypothetical protein CME06_11230 [Gemmatimonadetes bacterium]|nr:hypothetical protein [Gemmatimonadota bacterium]